MISIKTFAFNPLQVNCYLVWDDTLECIIIDASCMYEEEFQELYDFIESHSLNPKGIINTHGHFDHLTGTMKVSVKYALPFSIHPGDKFLVENAVQQGRVFGFATDAPPGPTTWLNEGQIIKFGNSSLQAIHAPGHSQGSMVFYCEKGKFLISGDVLFAGSIGRTDLSGGNYEQLIGSIRSKILVLPPDTKVFPGHGPSTTVGDEANNNPFLNNSF